MRGSLNPTATTPAPVWRVMRVAATRARGGRAALPEAVLLGLLYAAYRLAQHSAPLHVAAAVRRGRDLLTAEAHVGAAVERAANGWLTRHALLANAADYYYAVLHFGVTLGVLAWLWFRHRDRYPLARNTMAAMNVTALAVFWLLPTAPPRLVPGAGFVDTVVHFHTWGSWASPQENSAADQFASIPSLHVGWALWCAAMVTAVSTRRWVRRLVWCYPLCTSLVVVATGNHYVADVVAGAAALACGYLIAVAASRLPVAAAVHRPRPLAGSTAPLRHLHHEPVTARRAA